MRRVRFFYFAFFLAACLSPPVSLCAQRVPAVPVVLGHSVVALTGPWKFHVGDNPKWADANFDDSQWETVSLNAKQDSIDPTMGFAGFVPGWTAKGHPGYSGFAWYRIRVRITGADEPLALMGPSSFDDSYQIFVNGRAIGSFGDFNRPIPTLYADSAARFALPDAGMESGADGGADGTAVIAFRFYMSPTTLLEQSPVGGFHAPPVIGFANSIAAAYHVAWEDQYRAVASLLAECLWWFVFAALVLMLYIFDRTETILLWPLGAGLLGALTFALGFVTNTTKWLTFPQGSIARAVAVSLWAGFLLMTFCAYFGLREKKWLRNAIAVLIFYGIFAGVVSQILLDGGNGSPAAFTANAIDSLVLSAAGLALLIAIAWLAWRRSQREHWTLFLALFLFAVPNLVPALQMLHVPTTWYPFRVPVPLNEICHFALVVCLCLVFLRHFRSSQRRQQAMEQDVAQAQQVQQVLIPENLPHVAGLTIESEYRPAREVGGDFFQIIPDRTDDSVLMVAGDVTGKGLQAGMLVALIVGAIRTEAAHGGDPLAVLDALNQRLCGRGHAHATGLALRIAADGSVALANAGHLPPYLNGKELPMEGALPLGMIADAEFPLLRFQLEPGDVLMLLSDGIAEAQDAKGQLFGFDRIRELLQRPVTAAEVASVAQQFGQQDDISVLRVVREGTVEETVVAEPAAAMG